MDVLPDDLTSGPDEYLVLAGADLAEGRANGHRLLDEGGLPSDGGDLRDCDFFDLSWRASVRVEC